MTWHITANSLAKGPEEGVSAALLQRCPDTSWWSRRAFWPDQPKEQCRKFASFKAAHPLDDRASDVVPGAGIVSFCQGKGTFLQQFPHHQGHHARFPFVLLISTSKYIRQLGCVSLRPSPTLSLVSTMSWHSFHGQLGSKIER